MVSYETVRRWVNHFGPIVAADLRKRRPKPVYDQKPQGERLRPCAGDQVRLNSRQARDKRQGCLWGKARSSSFPKWPSSNSWPGSCRNGRRPNVRVRSTRSRLPRPADARVALDHGVLDFDSATHGVHHGAELDQRPVAGTAGGGPSMRLGGRIDRPPRQALRARSHWDHALAARVATAR